MVLICCLRPSDQVADCDSKDGDGCCETGTSLNKYSWEQITKWSNNFSTVIGCGGVSIVYLAQIPDSGLVALKIQSTCTERLARIHDQELQILVGLKHRNIVMVLGYCDDREEERVLVFDYASNGTLHDKLHDLPWKSRCLIAFQVASALEYLHEMQIIHGDIKSSNILLDRELNCKLCDFGSAKVELGFTNSRMIVGSQGYVDPHYMKTGLASKKNDVYSFGVVLLELVTGREAFNLEKGEMLTEIVGPVVRGLVGVEGVVDPRVRYLDIDEVRFMVSMAGKCIGGSMTKPSAQEIVASIKDRFQFQTIS